MKTFFGFGRMRALAALVGGVFVFLTLGACAGTSAGTSAGISKVYHRRSASANGEIIGTVETDLFLNSVVHWQSELDNISDKAHKALLAEARKQYTGNIDVVDVVFGERQLLWSSSMREKGYVQSIKLTGNVFLINSAPSVATPSPSTVVSAIPVQATQPAPLAPLVQLPLEKIFVGGTPPQGTRDDYAAVLPSLNDALDWLDIYTKDGGNYAIVLGSDQTVNNGSLGYGYKRVTITLTAFGGGRTVKGAEERYHSFDVEKDVNFILEEGVTLSHRRPREGNSTIVSISGGTFIMNGGTLRDANDGAVSVGGGGNFTMNGGTISGNKRENNGSGGGVYVGNGSFTMKGGTISGNFVYKTNLSNLSASGGGVDVDEDGVFTMEGGVISGNSASISGGGVNVGGTFTMTGGTISGNETQYGGGVHVGGTFTMSGGNVSGNTASISGGAVYVTGGNFTMKGGTINGNTARRDGGGVYVESGGTFNLNSGTIGANSANKNGGGVYVESRGTFTKSGTGGIIYGSNAPAGQANKAPSEAAGHAVYVDGSRPQKRTTTAGETTALDSTKNLVQGGGWE